MSWSNFLEQEQEELKKINEFLDSEYIKYGDDLLVLPPSDMRFLAFDICPLDKVKVCIWGQDPYHNRGEAMGLCFSVPSTVKIPPSLRNIYKELESDLNIKKDSGDLSLWAEQGVLLLNSALTVREHCPNSHQKHWRNFTNHAIEYLSNNTSGVVFILWGNNAKQKEKLIDTSKHHILKATHPSPLSANRGGFFGCKHFSQTNQILENQNMTPIQW